MNLFNIERSFRQMKERNWKCLYWCIDLHDTIIEGKYKLHNDNAQIFPHATNVLKYLSDREDQKLILWTSSHDEPTSEILKTMKDKGIHFDYINCNPECINTDLCNFDKKFYFNILLDDKAGFDGQYDWYMIHLELRRIGEWK